ncbi:MAG TPA: hypothetical protein VFX86_01595 [Candidatus Saccharimonadales bacterium]|nr:hypothetical protein [Candidatus Saccharimonadales bacterium]
MSSPEAYHTPIEHHEMPEIGEGYLPENVSVHFVFGPHADASHFDAAAQLLDDCDIFIPELVAWDEDEQERYTRITKASGASLEKIKRRMSPKIDGYTEQMIQEISGTFKPIVFIDARAEDLPRDPDSYLATASSDDYEGHLEEFYNSIVDLRNGANLRDIIMVTNLGPAVTDKIREHPRLRNKEEVSALVTLGSAHYPVFQYLAEQEETCNKVSASSWSMAGLDYAAMYKNHVGQMVAEGQPISRQELIGYFIASILEVIHPGIPRAITRDNQARIFMKDQLFKSLVEADDLEGVARMFHNIALHREDEKDKVRFNYYLKQAHLETVE